MANKTYAKEWLTFSIKNLNTAKLLFDVNHSRDEIKEVLDFTENLFNKVCKILDINIEELKYKMNVQNLEME